MRPLPMALTASPGLVALVFEAAAAAGFGLARVWSKRRPSVSPDLKRDHTRFAATFMISESKPYDTESRIMPARMRLAHPMRDLKSPSPRIKVPSMTVMSTLTSRAGAT